MSYPFNQIPTSNPQNISIPTPIGLQSAPRDPTPQDNTFVPGSEWQNTVSKIFFKCVSSTISGAVWTAFVPSSAGTVSTLTGNSGGAVSPTGGGNINVVGDGTTITIVGSPGTNTLTASIVGGGMAAQSFTTNVGGPVSPTIAGVINLNASTSTFTNGATANTIKIELQGTDHAMFVGNGANVAASTIAVGTNGQVLIGATAADPAFATITSGDGSITFTTGANSLDMVVAGGAGVGKTVTGDSGGPLPPTAGNWNFLSGGGGINISGAGSTLTFTISGGGLSWHTINASQALVSNNGYFCVTPGGALALSLPATSVLGDTIRVLLNGSTSFQITQAAGQQIRVGAQLSTLGAPGTVTSTAQGNSIELICMTANTIWEVGSSYGNFLVV